MYEKCKVEYCRVKTENGYCEKHIETNSKQKDYNKTRYSPYDIQYTKFYKTTAWKRAREQVLYANPMCTTCLEKGILTPAKIVHHIVELRDNWDLRLEISNLEGSCRECHNRHHKGGK